MMTLEQLGLLAILSYEANQNVMTRRHEGRPLIRAYVQERRARNVLERAIRDYKLLQEAKGK